MQHAVAGLYDVAVIVLLGVAALVFMNLPRVWCWIYDVVKERLLKRTSQT